MTRWPGDRSIELEEHIRLVLHVPAAQYPVGLIQTYFGSDVSKAPPNRPGEWSTTLQGRGDGRVEAYFSACAVRVVHLSRPQSQQSISIVN